MERKGSAKKWGGLFKLFGRTETDTKEEDEAQNSVQESMKKEIEVQDINNETNYEHNASASENVTSKQQFAEATKGLLISKQNCRAVTSTKK